MTFDPSGYALVADRMRQAARDGECPADAALRAGMGRYYYAALLLARDYIATTESMPVNQTEKTHQWVIGKLRDSTDPESVKLTSELNTMRVKRNAADYGDEIPDLPGAAERMGVSCRRAMGFIATLTKRYGRK